MNPTGLSRSSIVHLSAERSYGEKLVPTGHATKGRHTQELCNDRSLPGNMLGRDTLQFQVAADSAVSKKQIAKRGAAPAKSRFAKFAPPGKEASQAKQIVKDGPAPGTP